MEQPHPFDSLCQKWIAQYGSIQRDGGIGTLGERTLHAVLKEYFQPDSSLREIPLAGFVADIRSDSGIIEVQTRQLSKLCRKLDAFLPLAPVTVVYPVAQVKWLCWVDPETGESSARRRSPKRGEAFDILEELYWMRRMLGREGLQFRVVLLELMEYRLLDGWSRDKKKGSQRVERIPLSWRGEVLLKVPGDFLELLPFGLEEPFTVEELAKRLSRSQTFARRAIAVLRQLGLVQQQGKRGRRYLYQRSGETAEGLEPVPVKLG